MVELLVVIAIIALLLAILLPAISKAKELAARSVCGTNNRSLVQASIIIADERDNNFMASQRDIGRSQLSFKRGYAGNTLSDHLTQINFFMYQTLLETGLELDTFNCPNRKGREDVTNFALSPKGLEPDDFDKIVKARLGYYYMAGRPKWRNIPEKKNEAFAPVTTEGGGAWTKPQRTSQDGVLVLSSDMNEAGTDFPSPKHSSYAHGGSGLVYIYDTVKINDPEAEEAVGGNTGFLDGSVLFQKKRDFREYNVVASNNDKYRGWWSKDCNVTEGEEPSGGGGSGGGGSGGGGVIF